MRRTIRRWLLGAAILLAAHGSADAVDPISVTVYPRVAMALRDVMLSVRVEPDERNRWLTWEVDGPSYYRNSTRQVNGASSPRMWQFVVKDLTEGDYVVRAVISRDNESQSIAEMTFAVVSAKPPSK